MKSSSAIAVVLGLSALSGAWSHAYAQVATTAPVIVSGAGTSLDITTSGTPIINIAAPRADGTSYNVFSRLNVGQEGLILNNSQAIGQSQIGGTVLANQNLQSGGAVPARLILNEVVAGTRSDLNGAIEVFGTRAGVVIANPAGITCDGCGFINISRASLSTGRPTFDGGNAFTGLQVDGGSVIIQGRGLSGGSVDFFDIVTGSASINADLYARDLVISGGAANFNYAARTTTASGALSGVVIDSSVLGGMYANRIRLIGSGTGVGINLRGAVSALSGGVSIATDGAITVRNVDAGGDIAIASRASSVRVEEYLTSGGSTVINAAGNIEIADNQAAVDEATITQTYYNNNYDYNGYYDQNYSQSTYESTYSPIALAAASIDAGGVVSLTSGGNIIHTSRGSIAGNVVIASAASDILIGGGSSIYGGDIALDAGRDVNLTATTQYAYNANNIDLGRGLYSNSVSSNLAVTGADIDATGTFIASAGRDLNLESAVVNAGGIASLSGGRDVAITGIGSTATTTNSWKTSKRVTGSSVETVSIYDGSSINAGGALFVNAREELDISGSSLASNEDIRLGAGTGTVSIAGSDISAFGDVRITGQNILVAGSLNSSSFDETIRTVKRGFLSKRTTTAITSNDIETIFASTISGNHIMLASAGDINILDSNIVSERATDILAGNSIVVGSIPTTSSYYNSFKIKKSGISIGSGGFFAGVSKSSQITTLDTISNIGSIIGAARGDVSLSAGVLGLRNAASGSSAVLLIKGSEVSGAGRVTLSGDTIAIENNFDSANSTSAFRQSSIGLSINAYENISPAINSLAGFGGRIDAAGQGTAGTAISAASETLRTVRSLITAVTNTAGITATFGISSSRRSNAAQESNVVASNISGGSIDIRATDLLVAGSTITAVNDMNIVAQRDAIFESALNRLATQDSSSSSSFGIGATLGVGIVGGFNVSAFVNFGSSRSNGSSLSATQFNSQIVSGGLLTLNAGRDVTLRGAVVQGRDVALSVNRNLLIQSVQDSASSNSNSSGYNFGLTYGGGQFGFNAGLDYGYGSSTSGRVREQSSLIARGGALNGNVAGNTSLIGGVIAALDSGRADSGRLAFRTGTLNVANIADSANSLNYGFGLSINFNDIFNEGVSGADYPVFDGYYGSTAFAQDTRATIGSGSLVVDYAAIPADLNRDITQSQVVTKDRATGFSLYLDYAAGVELYNLVDGLANGRNEEGRYESVILRGVDEVRKDFDGDTSTRSDIAQDVRNATLYIGKIRTAASAERDFNATVDAAGGDHDLIDAAEVVRTNRLVLDETQRLEQITIDTRLNALDPSLNADTRATLRVAIEAEVRTSLRSQEGQDNIRRTIYVRDTYDAARRNGNGRSLTEANLGLLRATSNFVAPVAGEAGYSEEIVVTGYPNDAARVRGANVGLIRHTANAVRRVSDAGGGTVLGVGTGVISNATDTFNLLTDAGGKLLNLATFNVSYRSEARRTDSRIAAAADLGRRAISDPRGTALQIGGDAVAPIIEGAGQLRNGQIFEGTANISEAGSGLILSAIGGGLNSIRRVITGRNGGGGGFNGNNGNDGADQADTPETADGQTGFSGRRGEPLSQPIFQPSRNKPTTIGGRDYSGHALDQMQNRGLTPTVVENAINPANQIGRPNAAGESVFIDRINGVKVITNSNGRVITAITVARRN